MSGNKISYLEFCPNLPNLGEYISGFDGRYRTNLLRLFALCSDYGYEMLNKNEKSGLIAVMGSPYELRKSIGKSQRLATKDGNRILSDPAKTSELFRELGENDVDGALLFDPYGNLRGVGVTLRLNPGRVSKDEMKTIMRIKGKNGEPNGTKFPAALYVTGKYDLGAVATSERNKHVTVAVRKGKILKDLAYDPSTGLYGLDLFRHLGLETEGGVEHEHE
jgi:hypothetical protein